MANTLVRAVQRSCNRGPLGAEFGRELRVTCEGNDMLRHRTDVTLLAEQTRHTMIDHLANPGMAGRDDRESRRHRLHHSDGRAFTVTERRTDRVLDECSSAPHQVRHGMLG